MGEQDTGLRQVEIVCTFKENKIISYREPLICLALGYSITQRVLYPVIPSADSQPVKLLATLAYGHQLTKNPFSSEVNLSTGCSSFNARFVVV